MDILISFLVGVVAATVVWFLIARNNKKHVTDILNLDPRAKWGEILKKIREKL
ncbi:MAG: hypothetical protein JRI94_00080 [Deltaproteobacteria bacterium]|nr:hypothetical protein [Deltaproteobacteria bacterium]MBW2031979.1 hypothetical protein [Deltaproteobacteria bacterium]